MNIVFINIFIYLIVYAFIYLLTIYMTDWWGLKSGHSHINLHDAYTTGLCWSPAPLSRQYTVPVTCGGQQVF